jgi:hypothetical protein
VKSLLAFSCILGALVVGEASALDPQSVIATLGERPIRYEDISCPFWLRESPDCRTVELRNLRQKVLPGLIDIAATRLGLSLTDEELRAIADHADEPEFSESRQQSAKLFRCGAELALLLQKGETPSDDRSTPCPLTEEEVRRIAERSTREQLISILQKDLVLEMRQSLIEQFRYSALSEHITATVGTNMNEFWTALVTEEFRIHNSEFGILLEELLP